MKVLLTKYLIDVVDMSKMLGFYRDTIGLTVLSESEDFSELDCGGARLALHSGGAIADTHTGLSFLVDDIDAACETIVAGGGQLDAGPYSAGPTLRLAELRDPEKNSFMLSAE